MPEPVHGHEVMKMMIDDGRIYSKTTLLAAIAKRFGEGAKFYACTAENMTAEGLVAFLEGCSKGRCTAGCGPWRQQCDGRLAGGRSSRPTA